MPDINNIVILNEPSDTELLGDVDGDKSITARDAQLALKQVVADTQLFSDDIRAYVRADVAGDGDHVITARDAYKIASLACESD